MKVLTVVGARPQFIKAAPVCKVLRSEGHREILVHTGQHYDPEMSRVFFDEMDLPEPDFNLGVGSGSHGAQTGQMMIIDIWKEDIYWIWLCLIRHGFLMLISVRYHF